MCGSLVSLLARTLRIFGGIKEQLILRVTGQRTERKQFKRGNALIRGFEKKQDYLVVLEG